MNARQRRTARRWQPKHGMRITFIEHNTGLVLKDWVETWIKPGTVLNSTMMTDEQRAERAEQECIYQRALLANLSNPFSVTIPHAMPVQGTTA